MQMRIRDLIESPLRTKLPTFNKTAIRARRCQPPTEQEQMDAAASEHRVDVAPPEAPPDAAFMELHGTPWIPPTYE
jgi:hypothetical protein